MHAQFRQVKTGDGIELSENGKKVLFYQTSRKQNNADGKIGYVHPLYDPNGVVLTEDMPADHPYHHGLYLAWTQVYLGDKKIANAWISENVSYHVDTAYAVAKKGSARLHSGITWSATQDGGALPLLKENTTITVSRAAGNYRVIDYDIRVLPLQEGLKIGGSDDEKGYGGFSLRLRLPKDVSFVSGQKAVEPTVNAVEAGPWMNISGTYDTAAARKGGVVIFAYPSQEGKHPWILRRETSMQNVPYPGRTPAPVPRGGWHFKYRVVVYSGELSGAQIEKLYLGYQKEARATAK